LGTAFPLKRALAYPSETAIHNRLKLLPETKANDLVRKRALQLDRAGESSIG